MGAINDIASTINGNLSVLKGYRFAVNIDGDITENQFVAGFNQIQGLGDAVEIETVKEGGYPGVYNFPRFSNFRPIKLVKGMSFSRSLWDWYHSVRMWTKGKPSYLRSMSIYILDSISLFDLGIPYEVWRFDFFNAYPSEWAGPELNSNDERLAFESITIQHSGLIQGTGLLSGRAGKILDLV